LMERTTLSGGKRWRPTH